MKAIWSQHTGIVDWGLVTEHYGKNFRDMGGSIYLDFEVKDFNLVEEDGDKNSDNTKYPVRVVSDGKVSISANHLSLINLSFFYMSFNADKSCVKSSIVFQIYDN